MPAPISGRRRRAELTQLSPADLREALISEIRSMVAEASGRDPREIPAEAANPDPMLLYAVLQPRMVLRLGFPLCPYDLAACRSIVSLAEHLALELSPPPAPAAPMEALYETGDHIGRPSARQVGPALERPILFVISAPRSGSTLLGTMLARHPKIFATSELCLLPFDSMGARRKILDQQGQMWMRIGLLAAIRDLTGMSFEAAMADYQRLEERDVPVAAVYERIQQLAQNRILLDKSPIYALDPACLASAERLFREPTYIHLTRHPGAVIESLVRMRFHRLAPQSATAAENPWIFGEKVWTGANLHTLEFLRGVSAERQLRVRYEDLVRDPAKVLAGIAGFLGIGFDRAMLKPYGETGSPGLPPDDLRAGDPGFFGHSGIEPELASDWQAPPQRFGTTTRQVCAALGYPAQ